MIKKFKKMARKVRRIILSNLEKIKLESNGKEHDIYAHNEKDYEIQISRHDSEEVKNRPLSQTKKTNTVLKVQSVE